MVVVNTIITALNENGNRALELAFAEPLSLNEKLKMIRTKVTYTKSFDHDPAGHCIMKTHVYIPIQLVANIDVYKNSMVDKIERMMAAKGCWKEDYTIEVFVE